MKEGNHDVVKRYVGGSFLNPGLEISVNLFLQVFCKTFSQVDKLVVLSSYSHRNTKK